MSHTRTASILALALLTAVGCSDRGDTKASPRRDTEIRAGQAAATRPTEFTGTLRGGAVAIGGETTGWRLEGDGQTGGIDLDVSRVQARARQLDGKRVTVTGKMTTRSGPERGEIQVLVADKLEPAPEPKP